jgi:hypothetical protein
MYVTVRVEKERNFEGFGPFLSLALSSLCVPADGRGRGQETNKTTAKEPLPKIHGF